MRLLYVVQRYGLEVAGGAELHCRQFATELTARGHEVHVLTSCAKSYVDWANHYPPGESVLDGVTVHRLPVRAPRDPDLFSELNQRAAWSPKPVAPHLQRTWMVMHGPTMPEMDDWLRRHAPDFDVVIFFSYLFHTTWAGMKVTAGLVPTVLHPTAHDEPPLYLPIMDLMFRLPHLLAMSTREELDLLRRRFGLRTPAEIIGIGMDLDATGDGAAFRHRFGIGDRPYLLFVGRVDPGKGTDELARYFVRYKERNPSDLALVIVGDPLVPPDPHPDVILTGYVDEADKRDAIDGCLVYTHPSYFESFSMILAEAWAQGKAALVQGRCAVLAGQARRSGGGIPYDGFASFEMAVNTLLEDPGLVAEMGEAGRRYVRARYSWDTVMGRYERLLERAAGLRAFSRY